MEDRYVKCVTARDAIIAAGFACSSVDQSEDGSARFHVFFAGRSYGYVIEDFFYRDLKTTLRLYIFDETGQIVDFETYFDNVASYIKVLKEEAHGRV